MAFLDRIRECNDFDLSNYVPFHAGGALRVGWIRRDRLEVLRDVSAGLPLRVEELQVVLEGADRAARSATMGAVHDRLAGAGAISLPYGELFPIALDPAVEPVVALLDRSAVAWFGVQALGVHVNGFVRDGSGLHMWVATRSREKPMFPGMLDNMVAGGQPYGLTPTENVIKECAEEAGIPARLAGRARAAGAVRYVAEHDRGLKPDTMLCFDLELPREFRPVCVDGEVERFDLMPIGDVVELVRETTRFKFNCNLVILDFCIRHGCLDESLPDYDSIVRGLRGGLPDDLRPE